MSSHDPAADFRGHRFVQMPTPAGDRTVVSGTEVALTFRAGRGALFDFLGLSAARVPATAVIGHWIVQVSVLGQTVVTVTTLGASVVIVMVVRSRLNPSRCNPSASRSQSPSNVESAAT